MKRQDKQYNTRQDKTRQGKTRQGKTRQDKTRQDKTRQGKTRQGNQKTTIGKHKEKTRQNKRFACCNGQGSNRGV